jgi:uncharacterized protein YbcI
MNDAVRQTDAPEKALEPSVPARVSNEMVRIYKELFGRGPTRARTNFAGPDVLVVTQRAGTTAFC